MMASTDTYNDAPAVTYPGQVTGDIIATLDGTAPPPPPAMLPGCPVTSGDTEATYPGGKGHVYQKIINLILPHRVYIETHAGGGTILQNKRPARLNIAIDLDPDVIKFWSNHAINDGGGRWQFINGDAVTLLRAYDFQGDEFVYADPPYLMETRKQQRPLYRYEYTRADHLALLGLLAALPCKVMISGCTPTRWPGGIRSVLKPGRAAARGPPNTYG